MSSSRVANLSRGWLIGPGSDARPDPFLVARHGLVTFAVILVVSGISTASLSSPLVTSAACVLLLVVGLPHGALDIAAIRRLAPAAQLPVVCTYLAAAVAMLAVWWISPLAGLAIFYVVSIAHFADDWCEASQPFFAYAMALALLAAPTVLHSQPLKALFVALTGDERAIFLVDILTLTAPVASAIALVGLSSMKGVRQQAETICALMAMVILPPLAGFAVFFCLFHSPRHFREGWAALGPNVQRSTTLRIAAMTVGGFGFAAIIYAAIERPSVPASLFVTSMMTLSALTVPHMLLAALLSRHARILVDQSATASNCAPII